MIFPIRVIAIAEDGQEQVHEIPSLQRTDLKPETLGLTLAEGKAILTEIQRLVVEQQITLGGGTAEVFRLPTATAEQGVSRSRDAHGLRQSHDSQPAFSSL
jgi:hypothetical protein